MIIKLTSEVTINPEHVLAVEPSYYKDYIIIKMTDGHQYNIFPDYGKSIYESIDRITKQINMGCFNAKSVPS